MTRLLVTLGTRPEAIKLAPVVLAARVHEGCEVTVCHTGQHADMCKGVLALFGIAPEVDLQVMTPRQTLTDVTAAVLAAMDKLIATYKPDWLVVQGDTTSAFAASLAGFYHKVPVAHVDEVIAQALVRKPDPIEWVEPPEPPDQPAVVPSPAVAGAPLPH